MTKAKLKMMGRKMVSEFLKFWFFKTTNLFTDDEQGEEEEEADSEHESAEESDCAITNVTGNFSTTNFETSLDNSILLNSSVSDEDPVTVFYNNKIPTLESFNQIKEVDKLKAFKELLSNTSEDEYLKVLVYAILKLSSISEQSADAKSVAKELFKEAFEYGKSKDRVSFLS